MRSKVFIGCLCFMAMKLAAAIGEVSSNELNALQALFVSTNGAQWTWAGTGIRWDFSGAPAPCSQSLPWEGLMCGCPPPWISAPCAVTGLFLAGHNLQGPLPASLGALGYLNVLSLNDNHLTGPIPDSIGALMYCGVVDLHNNMLTGTIPASIGGLFGLQQLILNSNGLTGTIPPSIGGLANLQQFDMSNNKVGGSIPSSIGTMTSLINLRLNQNQLIGPIPPSIGSLDRLQVLLLFGNQLAGTIPSTVGQLTSLVLLILQGNQLTGTIPASVGGLVNLQQLYVNRNRMTGGIPSSLSSLSRLQQLVLQGNSFTGTLPAFLGQLSNLFVLDVSQNAFTGAIPSSLGGLAALQILYLQTNRLRGTIPSSIGSLSNLLQMQVGQNYLTGTIPASIASLSKLQILSLSYNAFVGTIPNSIAQLHALHVLAVDNNQFMGTLPSFLGSMVGLTDIIVNNNFLSGPLSTVAFTNLTSLVTLAINFNHFIGTLPMLPSSLTSLNVDANGLTGTIPDEYSALVHLVVFSFTNTHLSADAFPEYICTFHQLTTLSFSSVAMSGTIPACISNMTSLEVISLAASGLSGTIPDLTKLTHLRVLNSPDNFFTGALPVFGSRAMTNIVINRNQFHGTIPQSYGTLLKMTDFQLNANLLTGTVPRNLVSSPDLEVIWMSYNNLEGNLDLDFRFAQKLNTFVAGQNQFTGSIPEAIFNLPQLLTFTAPTNCLQSVIPQSICNASVLSTLMIDGLHTASACRHKIFPYSSKLRVYMLSEDNAHNTIPSCLFALPRMTSLHLSSAGLKGSLPDDITVSASLTDMSVSHNELQGTIPIAFQNRSWQNLDLSFNRFTGQVSKTALAFGDNAVTSLSLQVNKLSGDIPVTMKAVTDISILDGNLFACDYDDKQLPGKDESSDIYSCGSNSFNASYYAWLATAVLLLLLTVALSLLAELLGISQSEHLVTSGALRDVTSTAHASLSTISIWIRRQFQYMYFVWTVVGESVKFATKRAFTTPLLQALSTFSDCLDEVWILCGRLLFYMLVVLLPVYVTASVYYGTYQDGFAWTLSIAYLGGNQAGAMELVVLLVLLGLLVASLHEPWQSAVKEKKDKALELVAVNPHGSSQELINPQTPEPLSAPASAPAARAHPSRASPMLLNTVAAIVVFVNLALVGGINALFAYVTIYGTGTQQLLMQIALAVFGFVWNSDRIQWLSTELISWFKSSKSLLALKHSKYFDSAYLLELHANEMAEQHEMLHVQLWIAVINVVWIPSIVTAALSSSCFYYALRSPPQVHASFTTAFCEIAHVDGTCLSYGQRPSFNDFDPPFTYSYQCSSVLLTYYAPSLMYTCITDGFLSPFLQWASTGIYLWLSKYLQDDDSSATATASSCTVCRGLLEKVLMWMKWRVVPDLLQPLDHEEGQAPEYCGQTFVSSQGIMVTLVSYTALLLTFGVVFPPLGVALLTTIVIYIAYNRWMLGKFLLSLQAMLKALMSTVQLEEGAKQTESAEEQKQGVPMDHGVVRCNLFDALIMECEGIPKVLQTTKWMLVTTSCWFYGFFMADTIGYEHGTKQSYWVIVFMALVPFAFFSADWFAGYIWQAKGGK